jgi:hypothetical protein
MGNREQGLGNREEEEITRKKMTVTIRWTINGETFIMAE